MRSGARSGEHVDQDRLFDHRRQQGKVVGQTEDLVELGGVFSREEVLRPTDQGLVGRSTQQEGRDHAGGGGSDGGSPTDQDPTTAVGAHRHDDALGEAGRRDRTTTNQQGLQIAV